MRILSREEWRKMNKAYRLWLQGKPHIRILDPKFGLLWQEVKLAQEVLR